MQRSTHLVWWPTSGYVFHHSLCLGFGSGSSRPHCLLESHSLWSGTHLLCGNPPVASICRISDHSHPCRQSWAPRCHSQTQDRLLCPSIRAPGSLAGLECRSRADRHSDPPLLCIPLLRTLNRQKESQGSGSEWGYSISGKLQAMPYRIKGKPLLQSRLEDDSLRQCFSDVKAIRITGKLCKNTDCWAQLLEFLTWLVCGGAWELLFLTSSQCGWSGWSQNLTFRNTALGENCGPILWTRENRADGNRQSEKLVMVSQEMAHPSGLLVCSSTKGGSPNIHLFLSSKCTVNKNSWLNKNLVYLKLLMELF